MKNYHFRAEYERLLARLSIESGILVHRDVRLMSDYQLLSLINFRLIKLQCVPMDVDELERELI